MLSHYMSCACTGAEQHQSAPETTGITCFAPKGSALLHIKGFRQLSTADLPCFTPRLHNAN